MGAGRFQAGCSDSTAIAVCPVTRSHRIVRGYRPARFTNIASVDVATRFGAAGTGARS